MPLKNCFFSHRKITLNTLWIVIALVFVNVLHVIIYIGECVLIKLFSWLYVCIVFDSEMAEQCKKVRLKFYQIFKSSKIIGLRFDTVGLV